jgi:hypothetical protein
MKSRLTDKKRHEEGSAIIPRRILVFLDTPNLHYSITDSTDGAFIPDYEELLAIARTRGDVVVATALVNDGFLESGASSLRRKGYVVARSEGRDCDFRFVAEVIAQHRFGEIFLLCSGDHCFAELSLALRAIGKYVIVASALPSCSRKLRASADEFIPFPSKPKPIHSRGKLLAQNRAVGTAPDSARGSLCRVNVIGEEVSL